MNKTNISLKILGGGQEIGANCYLLEWGPNRIVLDSGLDPRKGGYESLPALDILKQEEIDAIILSHAHADHVGSLPFLVVNYLKLGGSVFMTPPNFDLIPHMLKENVKFVERERIPKEEQYYYHEFFDRQLIENFKKKSGVFATKDYSELFEIVPGISAFFFPAGHILGAAGVVITDGNYTFVYTGDISQKNHTIQPGCTLPHLEKVDCLLIESTHGSHDSSKTINDEEERLRLAQEISKTIDRGGHVLIPSFGLGRTQELAIMLSQMKDKQLIPDNVPVFYHVGMTDGVNQIYDKYAENLNNMHGKNISTTCEGINAYIGNKFKTIQQLSNKPAIFLFTSGMMNRGTPAASLASHLIKSEKHGIFFCGYIAPNELGFELANIQTGQSVCLDKEKQEWVKVVCPHIYKFSFSGHASRNDLLNIASHFNPDLAIWVHGDIASTAWLSQCYGRNHSGAVSIAPLNRETILLRAGTRKLNKHMKELRAVLVTVGTSLLTTYATKCHIPLISTGHRPTEEDLQTYIMQNLHNLPSLCAETNSLSRKGLNNSDILYFICGDNPEGKMCGSILKQLYEESYVCNVIEVEGLRPDTTAFREKGMKNLLEEIVGIIEDHGGNAIIHATGGFKAQIAVATMLGILMKCEVYYLYQDFDELVRLPDIPLDFDYQSILANKNHFFTILDGRRYWAMDEIYEKLPDSLKGCFQKDGIQKKYHLSSIGRGIFNSFERHMGKQSLGAPIVVKGESALWGTETDSFGKILNPVIGIIMERLNRYRDLIEEFEFSSAHSADKAGYKSGKDNYLDLIKKGPNQLVYLIHHAAARKGLQDILTIKTTTGTSSYLLDMVGRRIYP